MSVFSKKDVEKQQKAGISPDEANILRSAALRKEMGELLTQQEIEDAYGMGLLTEEEFWNLTWE